MAYLFIPNQLYIFWGDVFALHQEHLTVFTSDIVHRYCSWLVTPASCSTGGQYRML